MKNEKEKEAKKQQHLAIQPYQFHLTCDSLAITSTTTSVLSFYVFNLLLNSSSIWTRVNTVAVLAIPIHCNSKAARKRDTTADPSVNRNMQT